eukprot:scaffold5578_cov110-Isochrysis_galbana.AAC.6
MDAFTPCCAGGVTQAGGAQAGGAQAGGVRRRWIGNHSPLKSCSGGRCSRRRWAFAQAVGVRAGGG